MIETTNKRLPLYKKVTDQLRKECFANAGEMLPSLRQLSQKLDVNHATISRALRDLELEGIVEIVPRKGIFSIPKPELTRNIELIVFVSEQTNLLDVAQRIVEGMNSVCEVMGGSGTTSKATRSILTVPDFPDVEKYVAKLRARGVAGVVLLGFGYFDGEIAIQEEEFITKLAQKLPVVLAGSPHPTLRLDSVYGDPTPQMADFLSYCYQQGITEFEYLGDRGDNLLQRERRDGFCKFASKHNIDWAWDGLRKLDTGQLANQLRSIPDFPQAVVATNVRRGLTIALEAQRRGLSLPEDLKILCFASLLEHAQPLLPYASVIMMDEPGVGEQAAQILHERLKNGASENGPTIKRVHAHFISGPLASNKENMPLVAA
jgi:DNA-binding LacI/PurR family transcriptional regulator